MPLLLITLFKSHQAHLLPALFPDIIIPTTVWTEVIRAGSADIAAQQLPTMPWATPTPIDLAPEVLAWGIDPGESAVLSFALRHPTYRAVLDDAAARRCARTLGIRVLGTCGVLVLAKQRGIITSVTPGISALQSAGLYLSESLIQQIKLQAGEDP